LDELEQLNPMENQIELSEINQNVQEGENVELNLV